MNGEAVSVGADFPGAAVVGDQGSTEDNRREIPPRRRPVAPVSWVPMVMQRARAPPPWLALRERSEE